MSPMLVSNKTEPINYYLSLFEGSRRRQGERLQSNAVNVVRGVLRHVATMNGVTLDELLSWPGRALFGVAEKLREYLKARGASPKAVRNYIWALTRFMRETGLTESLGAPRGRIARSLSPQWTTYRERARELAAERWPLYGVTTLGVWASESGLTPDDLAREDHSDEFYTWISQANRYAVPSTVYGYARRALDRLAEAGVRPAVRLKSRAEAPLRLQLAEWPEKLRSTFEPILLKWRSAVQVRGGRYGGALEPDTRDRYSQEIQRYVAHLRTKMGACLDEMTFSEIWRPSWVLQYGEAMRARITARAMRRFPSMLHSELERPTSTVAKWYSLAASIMAHDLQMSAGDVKAVLDANRAVDAKCRVVRDKDELLVPWSDLDRICDGARAKREAQEHRLLRMARSCGIAAGREEVTARLTEQIALRRANYVRLFKQFQLCGQLVGRELLLRLMRYRPLRSRNFRETRVGVNLTKDSGGAWTWRFTRGQIKTLPVGVAKWVAPIPSWLVPLLDYYLDVYWRFMRHVGDSKFLFLRRCGSPMADKKDVWEVMAQFSRHVLGRRVHPHIVRDVVVLEVLRKTNGNVFVAAYLIGDTVRTVEKAYNRWKTEHSTEVIDAIWESEQLGVDCSRILQQARSLKLLIEPVTGLEDQKKAVILKAIKSELQELRAVLRSLG